MNRFRSGSFLLDEHQVFLEGTEGSKSSTKHGRSGLMFFRAFDVQDVQQLLE